LGDDWGKRGSDGDQGLPLEILFLLVHSANQLANALSNNRCKAGGNWNESLPLEVFRKGLKVLHLSTVQKSGDSLADSRCQSTSDGKESAELKVLFLHLLLEVTQAEITTEFTSEDAGVDAAVDLELHVLLSGTAHKAANEGRKKTEEEVLLFLVPTETTLGTTEWSRNTSIEAEAEILLFSTITGIESSNNSVREWAEVLILKTTSTSDCFANGSLDCVDATLKGHIGTHVKDLSKESKVFNLKILVLELLLEVTHA